MIRRITLFAAATLGCNSAPREPERNMAEVVVSAESLRPGARASVTIHNRSGETISLNPCAIDWLRVSPEGPRPAYGSGEFICHLPVQQLASGESVTRAFTVPSIPDGEYRLQIRWVYRGVIQAPDDWRTSQVVHIRDT